MINVQQNEKEYTISVTIPFKKVAFSETPYKRDFKKFAEEVFAAYTIVIVQAIRARMEACASNLIKHSDNVMTNTLHILESLEENTHSLSTLMRLCKD